MPILNRDDVTLAKLLDLTNLWSLQDLQDIMLLCKQMKWSEGIETVLKSKSCHRQYLTIPHTSQNVFLQYVTNLPYQMMDDLSEDDSTEASASLQKNTLRVLVDGKKITE